MAPSLGSGRSGYRSTCRRFTRGTPTCRVLWHSGSDRLLLLLLRLLLLLLCLWLFKLLLRRRLLLRVRQLRLLLFSLGG